MILSFLRTGNKCRQKTQQPSCCEKCRESKKTIVVAYILKSADISLGFILFDDGTAEQNNSKGAPEIKQTVILFSDHSKLLHFGFQDSEALMQLLVKKGRRR